MPLITDVLGRLLALSPPDDLTLLCEPEEREDKEWAVSCIAGYPNDRHSWAILVLIKTSCLPYQKHLAAVPQDLDQGSQHVLKGTQYFQWIIVFPHLICGALGTRTPISHLKSLSRSLGAGWLSSEVQGQHVVWNCSLLVWILVGFVCLS